MIPDKDEVEVPWMVYWLESIKASGYNRYIVLKMTHYLTWRDRDKNVQNSPLYPVSSFNSRLHASITTSTGDLLGFLMISISSIVPAGNSRHFLFIGYLKFSINKIFLVF